MDDRSELIGSCPATGPENEGFLFFLFIAFGVKDFEWKIDMYNWHWQTQRDRNKYTPLEDEEEAYYLPQNTGVEFNTYYNF